jgi:hypothetical protein
MDSNEWPEGGFVRSFVAFPMEPAARLFVVGFTSGAPMTKAQAGAHQQRRRTPTLAFWD